MLLLMIAFMGGALTILSPCVLPVLPFVFARAGQSFWRSALPLLMGMMLTFIAVATLAAVGGAWVVRVNEAGRYIAMAVLALFGLALLSPSLSNRLSQPAVELGNRLLNTQGSSGGGSEFWGSMLLGVATGLLWAPCAGPILGLILTGAALSGPSSKTVLLLLSYGAGAALSLGLATLAGARVFALMKRSLHAGEWLRRGLGVAVLASVAVIALGWDTGVLKRWSYSGTTSWEHYLLQRLGAGANDMPMGSVLALQPAASSPLASFTGERTWLNSPALSVGDLSGKVVLVDFWTYSCINCLRTLPSVKALADKYRDHGLVVVGVHSPEFAFERDEDNVRRAVHDLGIQYPVVLDNDYALWKRFGNRYWPAHFLMDAAGRIRAHQFGEGHERDTEAALRLLLTEAGYHDLPVMATGTPSPVTTSSRSPETYLGIHRAARYAGQPALTLSQVLNYQTSNVLLADQWGLSGAWTVESERVVSAGNNAKISFNFRGRALHLVLGVADPATRPLGFTVRLDGADPQLQHGEDTDAHGQGTVSDQRLYRLIHLTDGDASSSHQVTIEFSQPGVAAYAFTFD